MLYGAPLLLEDVASFSWRWLSGRAGLLAARVSLSFFGMSDVFSYCFKLCDPVSQAAVAEPKAEGSDCTVYFSLIVQRHSVPQSRYQELGFLCSLYHTVCPQNAFLTTGSKHAQQLCPHSPLRKTGMVSELLSSLWTHVSDTQHSVSRCFLGCPLVLLEP